MLFHTPEFALLVVVCFLFYPWLSGRGQNGLLVVANIIFYLNSGLLDSTLFAMVLLGNYMLARRISGRPDWRTLGGVWVGSNLLLLTSNAGLSHLIAALAGADIQAFPTFVSRHFILLNAVLAGWAVFYAILTRLSVRVTLWAAVVLNLANLALFKYLNFFLGNAASVTHVLGVEWAPPVLDWVLPLGISFYTFQMIAYHVDIVRNHAAPPKHFGEFIVFIAFFAQLIAGPILRASQFLPQLQERRRITLGDVKLGALFILWGLVKKVVFGDTLSGIVDGYFRDTASLAGAEAWVAAVGFSLQIYFDFSGYSDIAVGLGHWFGFQLPRNFHQPYLSRDPREFWQRWHVTLSQWLRDYLYISLGGNRGSANATLRNLFLTMLLGGLWHGASWTFVIWGALHGTWLVAHRLWSGTALGTRIRETGGLAYRIACHVGVVLMLIVTWVFFRAETAGDALTVLKGMLQVTAGGAVALWLPGFFAFLAVMHVCEQVVFEDIPRASRIWHKVPAPGRGLVYAATWLLVVVFLREDAPFIYFRF